ncbi:unnamed protein product [Pseudo-nitzschia multistriata]|uniref:RRM domain-containing protein n=1 Tax=Pseudo-nitzschia multistriata TaxID=183589 RepID=A0A448Z033_9STRA|nr:unnamed protein product [Pseudo-nitzschia multistriata]
MFRIESEGSFVTAIIHWSFLFTFAFQSSKLQTACAFSGTGSFPPRPSLFGSKLRPKALEMTARASADTSPASEPPVAVANRLFLSHIDYANRGDGKSGDTTAPGDDLSQEFVKQQLEGLFSRFGSVQEIYLSEKEDPGRSENNPSERRPPFGFVAMETASEAQAALDGLRETGGNQSIGGARRLFGDVAPAKVHKSKNNQQNKNERMRSERRKEFRSRRALVEGGKSGSAAANLVCQVHTSHLDRLNDFVAAREGVGLVGSFSVQKGTSFAVLRVDAPSEDDGVDGAEQFSRTLWNTWYVAPNLNRVTLLDHGEGGSSPVVEGNLRTGVVPAIFRSLSGLPGAGGGKVLLRVAVFPPKLQRALLVGIEDYQHTSRQEGDADVELCPGNPTHTISVVQLHPGVVATPKSKGDNDKALYVLGRPECVSSVPKKRSLSGEGSETTDNNNNNNVHSDKYELQQQSTSVVPQPKRQHRQNGDEAGTAAAAAHNSNLKVIGGDSGATGGEDKSISRAYWKLQEAWERYRYRYEAPCLDAAGSGHGEALWALDCGAAPGGWTKFLFRPGVVGRIYAVDPGELSRDVVPGLDEGLAEAGASTPAATSIVKHVATTIQAAVPDLAADLRSSSRTNKVLDIWVSDMCCKDMAGQIDCFLLARSEGVVGPGTFFVLTLKCVVGYSATAFEYQAKEQVARLEGISRDVQVVHLFSNRSSERTIIGYLC